LARQFVVENSVNYFDLEDPLSLARLDGSRIAQGLLHQLLGIHSERDLLTHPKIGASWEGYVIEEVLAVEQPDEAFFWATHQGAEIDLILIKNGRLLGIECKRSDTPRVTP